MVIPLLANQDLTPLLLSLVSVLHFVLTRHLTWSLLLLASLFLLKAQAFSVFYFASLYMKKIVGSWKRVIF